MAAYGTYCYKVGVSQEWWGAEAPAQNEVWAAPKPRRAGKDSNREGCALERLADRLLDWFSVLMDDAGARPPPRDGNFFTCTISSWHSTGPQFAFDN